MTLPVLITTAIRPPEGVHVLHMTNVAKRLITSKGSIFFWAASSVDKLVIADATGQFLLNLKEVSLLQRMGVTVEQISYAQNHETVVKRGKGAGEGALIKYALENSNILKMEKGFYKCTGKMYCRNFDIINQTLMGINSSNMFWTSPVTNDSIDTRFFLTSKEFCYSHLFPAYDTVDDLQGRAIENVALEVIRKQLSSGTTLRPLISGFSGSTDCVYVDHGLGHYDYNAHCFHG